MTRGKHAVAAAKKREDRASILLAAARRENAELRRENARLEVTPVLEARIVRLEVLHQAAVKRIREIVRSRSAPARSGSSRLCLRRLHAMRHQSVHAFGVV